MQQLAALGDCPGFKGTPRRKRNSTPRVLKKDIVPEWACALEGVSKLTVKDLQGLGAIDIAEVGTITVPDGRLRAPYLEVMEKVFHFTPSKAFTVKLMREVLCQL